MKANWTSIQQYLTQVDTFKDNDGKFQSYIISPHTVLQLKDDDNWRTVNYVQHLVDDEDGDECICFQITDAPEDPLNYIMDVEYDIKVFLEIADRT